MAQGWVVDSAADTITFNEVPPNLVAIVVTETGTADVNATDIWAFGAWNGGFGYPAEVEFVGDRLTFANTYRQPQTMWMSKSGQYVAFGKSVPLTDEDAIAITINARQVNAIVDLVPLDSLLIMTPTCEWKLTTAQDGVIAPGKIGFKPQTFWGSGLLPALVLGDGAIFVQRSGNKVRDTNFQFADDKYTGNELTIYADHLVRDYLLVDATFQQHPFSTAWIVRDDGKLISITYVRDQQVVGFALHTTDGLFRRVCVVPEGTDDVLYCTVERENDNGRYLSIERMVPRALTDPRDAFFVDAGLSFDGRAQVGTVTLTGGVDWTPLEALTLTNSVAFWVGASDVGDVVRLRIASESIVNGELVTDYTQLRVEVLAYTSATVVQARALTDVPAAFQGVAIADWEICRDTFTGLDHLEGKAVAVLADGAVVDGMVVESGQLTLATPAAVVHIGLPYQSLIESLDLQVGQAAIRDRAKLISRLALLVKDTRGVRSGPDADTLDDFKVREFEDYEDNVSLVSGIIDVNVTATWDRNGRFVVVQDDPLPCTILAMIPDVDVGGVLR